MMDSVKLPAGTMAVVLMLAGCTRTDEAMLRATVAVDVCIRERVPVRHAIAEARDVTIHDLPERSADQLGRTRMRATDMAGPLKSGVRIAQAVDQTGATNESIVQFRISRLAPNAIQLLGALDRIFSHRASACSGCSAPARNRPAPCDAAECNDRTAAAGRQPSNQMVFNLSARLMAS